MFPEVGRQPLTLASPPIPLPWGQPSHLGSTGVSFSAHHLSYGPRTPGANSKGAFSEAGVVDGQGASGRLVGKKVEECGLQEVSALLLLSQRPSSLCTWVPLPPSGCPPHRAPSVTGWSPGHPQREKAQGVAAILGIWEASVW